MKILLLVIGSCSTRKKLENDTLSFTIKHLSFSWLRAHMQGSRTSYVPNARFACCSGPLLFKYRTSGKSSDYNREIIISLAAEWLSTKG